MGATQASRFLIALTLTAGVGLGQTTTFVTIPTSDNIQTALISTIPTGIFTANNVLATQFSIPSSPGTCGPSGASPCNYYDGFRTTGVGSSITMNVSIPNATDVYTLMNAYSPPAGVTLATIKFVGTGGAQVTYNLIGGQDIRDYYQGNFTNTLNNGISGVTALNAFQCVDPGTCLGSGGTGNVNTGATGTYHVDEQHYTLGAAFTGQTLTQIVITDTNGGSTPILLGVTVASTGGSTPSSTPIPSSAALMLAGLAGVGLFYVRRARRPA
jgi:hypothetical protein